MVISWSMTALGVLLSSAIVATVGALDVACPAVPGESITFEVTESSTTVSIPAVDGLCVLTVSSPEGSPIPVARSYQSRGWQRAGGGFAARLGIWTCNSGLCETTLPVRNDYVLQSRIVTETSWKGTKARFLEYASFGATPETLDSFTTMGDYVTSQINDVPPTYHREFYRRRLNPIWRFDKPDYAAMVNPCVPNSVWTRRALTVKDLYQTIDVVKVGDRWQLSINGHVRTMPKELRFQWPRRFVITEGSYRICSSPVDLQQGIYHVRITGLCRQLRSEDLMLDFPDDYTGDGVVERTVAALRNENQWQQLPGGNYMRPAGMQRSRCQNLTLDAIPNPPSFIKTNAGEWLQYLPSAEVLENSLDSPLSDGGHSNWSAGRTAYCASAPRSIFNEGSCVMADSVACSSKTGTQMDATKGAVVCGSPNEVANDPTLGDTLLDISSISNRNTAEKTGLPRDTTPPRVSTNMREYVWSSVVLTAEDQLRQRMAWALFQIFAMPKISLRGENSNTEMFINYYDIFVRHAFGNFRDVLSETTFSPMMAESLSYQGSISLGEMFRRRGTLLYPDENFARELMQLFTIGLVELTIYGTPKLDASGQMIQTYTSADIVSFARVWTGFEREKRRANTESPGFMNRIDPLRIIPDRRDKFPKDTSAMVSSFMLYDTALHLSHRPGYPLCSDLPTRIFLRSGAKFRLLGTSPVPEMENRNAGQQSAGALHLELEAESTGLLESLCSGTFPGQCTYPSVVVLDKDLACESGSAHPECLVETVDVVKVGDVFYEFIPSTPCVKFAFYSGGIQIGSQRRNSHNLCANPEVDLAGAACCVTGVSRNMQIAGPECLYAGERVSLTSARERCNSVGMEVCDYRQLIESDECPRLRYHWTGKQCKVLVKINNDNDIAIVHDTSNPKPLLAENSPNYFSVRWDGTIPSPANNCDGICKLVDDSRACLCEADVSNTPWYATTPASRAQVLRLKIGGIPEPNSSGRDSGNGFVIHDESGGCCDEKTVFEVVDDQGRTLFLRNMRSTVQISGSSSSFRNPPLFNSLHEDRVDEALHETDALLDHLFFHENTAPFIGGLLVQRFGVSNPSPRYVRAVAQAFRSGTYDFGEKSIGSGKYGDLASTVAAVTLDPERRQVVLDNDFFSGSLREPVLKVLGFMRAMEFSSTDMLVRLDNLDVKIGQAAYEQKSVFSFFRPEHSPPETARSLLVAPEAEVMSSGRVIGIMNGLFSLVERGLDGCDAGFGLGCRAEPSGVLLRKPSNSSTLMQSIEDFSYILTGGRMEKDKQELIAQVADSGDSNKSFARALQLILTSPEFHSTNKVDTSTARTPTATESSESVSLSGSYKAVIHFGLRGGCDSFNVLVPHPSCKLNKEYKDIRGSIAIEDQQLLELDGNSAGQPCAKFSLHGSLPYIKELYDDGDLLLLANTGVLTEPVDKTSYQELTVTQLFAHNAMQFEVDRLDPLDDAVGTGMLGRLADVLQESGFSTSRTAVESAATNLFGTSSNPSPIYTIDEGGVKLLDIDISSPVTASIVAEINGEASTKKSGVFGELWSTTMTRALNQTEQIYYVLQTTTTTQTQFSESQLGRRFKLISQLISKREERGVERDFFFVTLGGFDMHAEVTESLAERLAIVNEAIEDLVKELKLMGVWNDVAIIQTSEFARTLTPNSGGGSDHGYGGNYFMAGGSVRGKRIIGKYPESLLEDSDLNIGRGRIIPTTPFDSPFHGLAEWMGVDSDEDMLSVLPNKDNFANLFEEGDLFV